MKTNQFISKIAPQANKDFKDYNLYASLTIAQAIIESGWGKSSLASKYNNLFGIKWTPGCGYGYVELPTKEYIGGKYINVVAKFCRYESWDESIHHHTEFLLKYDRYKNVFGADSPARACREIYKARYATGKNYDRTLINVIKRYRLFAYDYKHLAYNDNLQPNFKWNEFWSGDSQLGARSIEPPQKLIPFVLNCAKNLQKVRDITGKPIRITSAYRTHDWNKHVGGVKDSKHLTGEAVDSRAIGLQLVHYFGYLNHYTDFKCYGYYQRNNFIHADLSTHYHIFKP